MATRLVRREDYDLKAEEFWRRLVVPEEDRHRFTTSSQRGGFRWFKSANVVPIEKWKKVEESDG